MSGKRELLHQAIPESNLERFLDCTTPAVPAIPLEKGWEESMAWEPLEEMPTQFFRLCDLWKCFDEWSAYGAAVPVLVNGGKERVVQYFVPYLSALQIYTTAPHKALLPDPLSGDFSDSETSRAEEMSDSDCSHSISFSSSSGSEKAESWDCGSNGSAGEQESTWCRPRDRLGHLYLDYFEHAPPHARVPLMEKINQLSREYPELNSLRSIDLSAASWMSVAWYPIYHIPASRTARDLSASFLTYHTLSFSFQDMEDGTVLSSDAKSSSPIRLPPFGIATYKLHGEVWLSGGPWDQHRLYSLWTSALSWLAQLQLTHPDFRFFLSHKD
ncbi:uncharacterized protein LOC116257908 [Nymphaea colorata]|nr:uncharacterized protein LOC116257908 [Nymphaea colorata]XP_031490793.1 uncharacterized protein LOC116257908 [Nymphaea colorata]